MPVKGRTIGSTGGKKKSSTQVSKSTSRVTAKTKQKATKSSSKPMTVQEAGRKGGNTVKEKYGAEFYSQIGQKGGEKVQAEAKRYRQLKQLGKV
jgi:uncharacterized protein